MKPVHFFLFLLSLGAGLIHKRETANELQLPCRSITFLFVHSGFENGNLVANPAIAIV